MIASRRITMMSPKKRSSLPLRRETIRTLTSKELAGVVGGISDTMQIPRCSSAQDSILNTKCDTLIDC